jgi:hypothetical protein
VVSIKLTHHIKALVPIVVCKASVAYPRIAAIIMSSTIPTTVRFVHAIGVVARKGVKPMSPCQFSHMMLAECDADDKTRPP